MNIKSSIITGLIIFFTSVTCASDINGRFVVTLLDSSKVAVLLQVNTETGTDAMGGATIVVGFDTASISLTNSPVSNVDYIFHDFYSGYYSPATLTRPIKNRIWINIDLPYNNSNNGTIVSDTSDWTDVLTIYFDVTDYNESADLYWISESPYWGIYKDDNLTLLNPGSFQNISYNFNTNNVEEEIIPDEFVLLQNYPNPFNPSTKISWQSPNAGHQTLKVYDILGNEVATLVDEFRDAGHYEVSFDAGNLASGIYVYRLIADSFIMTKKMVLLR